MFLRRLYSSAHTPSPRGAICNTAASLSSPVPTRPPTRGRIKVKPTRLSTISSSASATIRSKHVNSSAAAVATGRSAAVEGRGRRRAKSQSSEMVVSDSNRHQERVIADPSNLSLLSPDFDSGLEVADHSHASTAPTSTGPSSPRLTFTHPTPSIDHINTFRPVYLYPEQFKLHTTFTHPSHPLPLNLGTAIYTNPRKPSTTPIEGDIFAAPPPPDPTSALKRVVKGSGLNDHFRVISNLSHPRLSHNLGGYQPQPFLTTSGMGMGEMENASLSGTLGNKVAEMKEKSEQDWQAVLSKLEGNRSTSSLASTSSVEQAQSKGESDASLSQVVDDLTSVLSKLGLSSARGRKSPLSAGAGAQEVEVLMEGDEVVWMDSVKRKRKKKISKHKYKKRRKATRALRKRLGK